MKVHRVYTEQVEIKEQDEFEGYVACEVVNDFEDTEKMILTTNDEKVTCKRCLKIMRKK